ncbi:MAG: TraY domain-containing protein [Alteromonadaceae bacterium]|nr:TraY domain-containing protein [Alteromonadaceae bacterium]
MANMTVRNLPDEIHARLRQQAEANNRSLEAEVRSILTHSAIASSDGGFGHRIRERYGRFLGDDLSVERDQTMSQPGLFE